MSDYRVEFEEAFRFQELIASMRLPDMMDEEQQSASEGGYGNEEDGVWEARTATMAFINALTNCPDSLEERIMLPISTTRAWSDITNTAITVSGTVFATVRILSHPAVTINIDARAPRYHRSTARC